MIWGTPLIKITATLKGSRYSDFIESKQGIFRKNGGEYHYVGLKNFFSIIDPP